MRTAKGVARGSKWLALYAGLFGFLLLGPARMEWWIPFLAGCTFTFFAMVFQQQEDEP